jgi:hypothetical protein
VTVNVRGEFNGRASDDAELNVPSLPTQPRLYVRVPLPPDVRVKVYVRV